MLQLKLTHIAALLLALTLLGCGRQTTQQTFSQCEADAYSALGLQTDVTATAEYIEKKQEVVRLCMLKQGFIFESNVPNGAWMDISINIYKKYDVYETPQYRIPPDVQKSINDEIRKERAKLMLRSANWVK